MENFIALGRVCLLCLHEDEEGAKLLEYKKWDDFRFSDYSMRQQLVRTFRVRHLPLSDGKDETHFEGKYKFDWHKHTFAPRVKVKSEPAENEIFEASAAASATGPSGPPMIYDVEKGCLVPFE